jgi:hypothetical protein
MNHKRPEHNHDEEVIMTVPVLSCRESLKRETDWGIDAAIAAGYKVEEMSHIPQEKDLRAAWWQIGNQNTEEAPWSCVGWAVADSVLRWHFVQAKRIKEDETLSWRCLWMAAKETDEFTDRPTTFIEQYGTSLKAALAIAYKYGVVLDSNPNLTPDGLYKGTADAFYATAAQLRITTYFNLGTKQDNWRRWLGSDRGPIAIRMVPDKAWMSDFHHPLIMNNEQSNGKFDIYGTSSNNTEFGHACAIVGYMEDCFIIRNSWGTEWGKDGFALISEEYATNAIQEAYCVVL